MIGTLIGIVFAVIVLAIAWQENQEHIDRTGVGLPSSNARRRIRRNARKKGITEDQAYDQWLGWHQKRQGVSTHSATSGVKRTKANGGIVGYTAADVARFQKKQIGEIPRLEMPRYTQASPSITGYSADELIRVQKLAAQRREREREEWAVRDAEHRRKMEALKLSLQEEKRLKEEGRANGYSSTARRAQDRDASARLSALGSMSREPRD